jgi:hypothetical protein
MGWRLNDRSTLSADVADCADVMTEELSTDVADFADVMTEELSTDVADFADVTRETSGSGRPVVVVHLRYLRNLWTSCVICVICVICGRSFVSRFSLSEVK